MKNPAKGINFENPFKKGGKSPTKDVADKVINSVNSKKAFKK